MKKLLAISILLISSPIHAESCGKGCEIISESLSSTGGMVKVESSDGNSMILTSPHGAYASTTADAAGGFYGKSNHLFSTHLIKLKNDTKTMQYYELKFKQDVDAIDHHTKMERRVGLKPKASYNTQENIFSEATPNKRGSHKFEASTRISGESEDYHQSEAIYHVS